MNFLVLNNHQRRVFRMAFSVALSSAVAIGFAWPLSYLTPMLVVSIIGASDVPLGPKKSIAMLMVIVLGLISGIIFSGLFIGQPLLASLLLPIVFYWIYYASHRGLLPNFAGIMLLLGMTVIPLMSQVSPSVVSAFSQGFFVAALMALIFSAVSYYIFPLHISIDSSTKVSSLPPQSNAACHRNATISTLVVVPAILFFLTFNLISSALIIVFIAILSLNPALEQGRKASVGLLLGNVLGGAVAIVFYNLMLITPHYLFYVALMALFALYIAQKMHSDKKGAVLWGMAMSTLLVLTGPIFSGEGSEAGEKFSTRLFQIAAAAVYVIMAIRLFTEAWPVGKSTPVTERP